MLEIASRKLRRRKTANGRTNLPTELRQQTVTAHTSNFSYSAAKARIT